MKREQLARLLAKETNTTPGVAADQVDRIVSELLSRIRKGGSASLPGLGTFRPGKHGDFQFDKPSK